MVNEVGTLKELNVKRGDVVEWINASVGNPMEVISASTVTGGQFDGMVDANLSGYVGGIFDDEKFRIISRASDTVDRCAECDCDNGGSDCNWIAKDAAPKTWGEMTDAEKFPFLLDWSENNAENVQQWNGSEWIKMRTGRFGSVIAYRIKPEPKLENLCEEVEIYGKSMMAVYEVENGDIVPDSIKIEEL